MKESLKYRQVIHDARRVVIKIGSRVLVQKTGRPDVRRMKSLVSEMVKIRKGGRKVIVISSGAVGAGMELLGITERPEQLPDLQMAAAVGQTRLMSRYLELFGKVGIRVGQILLTHADFKHKMRQTNARRTIENLIRNGVVPIINENDAVTDEEIKADLSFGDNDYLASLVSKLVRADLLIMLTTVDGVRAPSSNGRTKRVSYLEAINQKTFSLVQQNNSTGLSKGGMKTKLKAAQVVSKAGYSVVIANGRQSGILSDIIAGKDVGTLVLGSVI